MQYNPYNYQAHAFEHGIANNFCGLFLDMGLGKTVITLSILNTLIYQDVEIERALVIAPKHVTRTVWKQEAQKWDHLKHLKISIVWGTVKERLAALREKADIYIINRENLVWLINLFQSKFPFSTVVIDELSSFKNQATQRFKSMKRVRPQLKRLIGLTGTPAPNSLLDIWAPLYLMDQGERLEKGIEAFRARYFYGHKIDGYITSYKIWPNAEKIIYEKIGDICISMKAKDYLDLPPVIENDIILELDAPTQELYDKFEEESIMQLANEVEITAMNAAALCTKLIQFANGAIYHEDKSWSKLHDTKLDALAEILNDSMGQSVLVFYLYRHDLERIMERFPRARKLKTPKDIEDWNNGDIEIMVAHPASAGHGLNLQSGGHIMIWFGLNWSLELYLQAIARLARQGQEHSVIIHRLMIQDTMDIDVRNALKRKAEGQDALMEAVKARVNAYNNKNV